jgi:hypothetical protein
MEMVKIELCEVPVAIDNYQAYDERQLPKILLGFQIKNKFDENRLQIKPEYNPKRIVHFRKFIELEPVFFYGIEIDVKQYYKGFFNSLIGINSIELYQHQLKQVELSCDDCYHYCCDGIYPIDLKHLSKIINNIRNFPINDLPSMLEITKEQWYLNIGAFGIYVLRTCKTYNNKI